MAVRSRKLKMIRRALASEHYAVEAIMVCKSVQNVKSEAVSIEGKQGLYVITWAGNSEHRRVHSGELNSISAAASGAIVNTASG